MALGELVDLVKDDDGLEAEADGLVEDETGLRHGPFGGVDEQEDAVGHVEDALDLAAEVGVSGGVDDVDLDVVVADRDVLGEDGDAALALDGVGVENAVLRGGFALRHAKLAEDGVYEGGLAMVDMRDDGDVSDGGITLDGWVLGHDGRAFYYKGRAEGRKKVKSEQGKEKRGGR